MWFLNRYSKSIGNKAVAPKRGSNRNARPKTPVPFTDKAKGTLKELATKEGYQTFVVPDDVGGRFSVLTAVGLLPIAVAGADIDALMAGAAQAREELCNTDLEKNDCYKYAAIRNILYRKGKSIEMLVSYEPSAFR